MSSVDPPLFRNGAPFGSKLSFLCLLVAALALPSTGRAAVRDDDAFVVGYATAVLEREFDVDDPEVSVADGIITVRAEGIRGVDPAEVRSALLEIEGVRDVTLLGADEAGTGDSPDSDDPSVPEEPAVAEKRRIELFPRPELFDPLLADPRWPHFSAAFQRYLNDDELRRVGATSFGETFALLGGDTSAGARWELGLQAGVFSIFDFDSESFDLVNSDFMVGLAGSLRAGAFSSMLRIFHQSSHLGDEFLLRNPVNRINLSYEVADLLVSYDVGRVLRIYGGGGCMFHREPSDLQPFSVQGGVELQSPWVFWGDHARLIAALDVQSREESDWSVDYSARGGIQLESDRIEGLRLQLLLAYYNGRSPNGQFFERDIEYLGIGTHLHY
jgi:hypothetical protein